MTNEGAPQAISQSDAMKFLFYTAHSYENRTVGRAECDDTPKKRICTSYMHKLYVQALWHKLYAQAICTSYMHKLYER
jgi:hypothetical protein